MTSTTSWIRPLTEAAAGLPTRGEVRGSRCRTSQDLFAEWAAGLGFPDHFGHNWNAFLDCLRDTVPPVAPTSPGDRAAPPTAVVVREAGDLLTDEPDNALTVLALILAEAADAGSDEPRLLLLLDDTPARLAHLSHRMTRAGGPPISSRTPA
ncbi:barstar family protein [Streptomyces sp. NBC_01485]|uniref:barstar family protein n=1 Tax=Streptomyces sp. NBC_01485 TaxID=2903884 RepID=UPI002E307BDE|nr:barstar family protein [Streptomyces sp. NBC_01485]